MIEKFEVKGVWRLPDNPNRTVNGILTFDPSVGGYLHLMGSFKDITQISEIQRPTIIQGLTLDGESITLYRCLESSSSFNQSGILTTIFYVQIIFVGIHFSSEETVQFKSMSVNFSYLDKWIESSGFKELQGSLREFHMIYKMPEPVKWDINRGLNISIDVHTNLNRSRLNNFQIPRDFHLSEKYYLKMASTEENTFDYYLRAITQLTNFLSLIVTLPVYPLIIEATYEVDKNQKDNLRSNSGIQVFFSMSRIPPNIQDKPVFIDVLFTYEEISHIVESMLVKWFEGSGRLGPVRELYFGTLYNTNMYLYHGFSSLAQAIESYHRRVFSHETELSEDIHKQRHDAIKMSVPVHRTAVNTCT